VHPNQFSSNPKPSPVPSLPEPALQDQIHGVVDTIFNRLASGYWGNDLASVLNARWQFSLINSSLKGAYGSVENVPMRTVSKTVAAEVLRWLKLRSAGTPSSVGNNLNYLNPYYSSPGSLKSWGWYVVKQAEKSGMMFGSGRATHFHGTSRGLEKYRPGLFSIQLDGAPDAFAQSDKMRESGGPRIEKRRQIQGHAPKAAHRNKQVSSIGWGPQILKNLFPLVFK
jgi:hypothetical protein